jgi:hypothetical protein
MLTTLGLAATRAVLPLDLAAGFAQLIRDLLTLDPSDRLLAAWRPLDHLIVLELLFARSPKLRRVSAALAASLDAWMGTAPDRTSLLYQEWIAGPPGASRACEVIGSLGTYPKEAAHNSDEWARKEAYSSVLHAVILYELGRGIPVSELERRWELKSLSGVEERWRDDLSWLLSGVAEMLDLRCFYFHLREGCDADPDRVKRVKKVLLHIRSQTLKLREHLSYCSPLGPVLRAIRSTRASLGEGRSIGVQSIRRLEEAGIRSLEDLALLETNDLVRLGIRRDFAEQIRSFVSEAGCDLPRV